DRGLAEQQDRAAARRSPGGGARPLQQEVGDAEITKRGIGSFLEVEGPSHSPTPPGLCPGTVLPPNDCQAFTRRRRCCSRRRSFSRSCGRLSCCFFPLASLTSSLTRPLL